MTALLADLSDRGAVALRWWRDNLARALPAPMRRALGRGVRVLEAQVTPGGIGLRLRAGDQVRPLGEVPRTGADGGTQAGLLRAALDQGGGFDRAEIVLGEDARLKRQIRLPLAARANLTEAVGYDLDRQTPFSPEEVYFAAMPAGLDRGRGEVLVTLELVRRSDIDPVLDAFDAVGIRPDSLRAEDGGLDLLPADRRPRASLARSARRILAVVTVALGVAVLVAPLIELQRQRAALEAELDLARRQALAVERLRDQAAQLSAIETGLIARKQTRTGAIQMLAALTRALPEDTWLVQLDLTDGRLTLTGYSADASAVIGVLEPLADFGQVSFAAPTVTQAGIPGERFTVTAELADTGGGAAP